jgi:hypothetical protein
VDCFIHVPTETALEKLRKRLGELQEVLKCYVVAEAAQAVLTQGNPVGNAANRGTGNARCANEIIPHAIAVQDNPP